ncbi:hypothetical protein SAMN05444159_1312 [Bradyrhizobium lablabi]|uniref:Uncharacterized protein n=1 Tax=Bradyrhizobium lablabi TaxID=722472 RepID=A0A1M6LLH2_9BRAD|nr:hypothetical protein SAMN05444159_1312 [Bradyrhizobium lablabi]
MSGLELRAVSLIEFSRSEVRQRFKRHALNPAFKSGFDGPRPVSGRDRVALFHLARVHIGKPKGVPEGNYATEGRDDV